MADTPLRRLRKKHDLTLEDTALFFGVDNSTLSRIERGIQKPSLALAERIVKLFPAEITELQLLYPDRYTQ